MSETQDWVIVYKSGDRFDIELIQARLKEMGVESVIFDHQDSMVKPLNDTNYAVSLHVHPDHEAKAREYITQHDQNEG